MLVLTLWRIPVGSLANALLPSAVAGVFVCCSALPCPQRSLVIQTNECGASAEQCASKESKEREKGKKRKDRDEQWETYPDALWAHGQGWQIQWSFIHFNQKFKGTLAGSIRRVCVPRELGVASLSPTCGEEITLKKKKKVGLMAESNRNHSN